VLHNVWSSNKKVIQPVKSPATTIFRILFGTAITWSNSGKVGLLKMKVVAITVAMGLINVINMYQYVFFVNV